jgi:hypothetical protein
VVGLILLGTAFHQLSGGPSENAKGAKGENASAPRVDIGVNVDSENY